jgi:GNAT superfamily N-acetyltransferase
VVALRYRHSLWQDAPDCNLEDLFVEDAARRHGLGAELVRAAISRARRRGCRRIELDVNDANAPAVALYERLGFSSFVPELGGHNRFMRLYLD